MNPRRILAIVGGGALIVALATYGIFFRSRAVVAQPVPAPVVQAPRPITDVDCGGTYEFAHLERFNLNGRVAVNFYFGGADRNRQPQYIHDLNVVGQSTEVREARRVKRSLEYSTVTFLCQSDWRLEGHKASNVEVLRYRLTLRRPLRQQRVIRNGGPAR